jgi:methionine-rich copper-binding protein CopC
MSMVRRIKSAFGAMLAVALTALMVGFGSVGASAHAELTGSNPIADSVIGMLPPTVELTFGEPLMVVEGSEAANQITVTKDDGKRIDKKTTTVADRVASVALDTAAGEGVYTVAYRVVSEDGHPIEGKFKFEVSVAAQSGEAEPVPVGEMPSDAPTAVVAPAPDEHTDGDDHDDASVADSSAGVWPWIAGGTLLVVAAGAAVFVLRRRNK